MRHQINPPKSQCMKMITCLSSLLSPIIIKITMVLFYADNNSAARLFLLVSWKKWWNCRWIEVFLWQTSNHINYSIYTYVFWQSSQCNKNLTKPFTSSMEAIIIWMMYVSCFLSEGLSCCYPLIYFLYICILLFLFSCFII